MLCNFILNRTKTILPESLPLVNMADLDHCLDILRDFVLHDLQTTWQYCRRQGLYESINILQETIKTIEPEPV
jgi:hypothetical protein